MDTVGRILMGDEDQLQVSAEAFSAQTVDEERLAVA